MNCNYKGGFSKQLCGGSFNGLLALFKTQRHHYPLESKLRKEEMCCGFLKTDIVFNWIYSELCVYLRNLKVNVQFAAETAQTGCT